jgi:hypothetical protein
VAFFIALQGINTPVYLLGIKNGHPGGILTKKT